MALSKAKEIVSSTPVVVFSKIYCRYCKMVKKLLSQLGASYKVIEMDEESDGSEIQSALAEWTGQRTVPSVFIGGKHIGGSNDKISYSIATILLVVLEKHRGGKLVLLLTDAGSCKTDIVQVKGHGKTSPFIFQ